MSKATNNLDRLSYEKFFDPTDKFSKEPRAFCYDLALRMIKKDKGEIVVNNETVNGIFLLLLTWNFAAPITKTLDQEKIRGLLDKNKTRIDKLKNLTICTFEEHYKSDVGVLFENFRKIFGQTGASKALSLINPKLFVMWDTEIRKEIKRKYIKGIGNGETAEKYIIYLFGVKKIIHDYNLCSKITNKNEIAKKFDEYNYVKIVLEK
jgi:hypothetical protein